MTLPVAVASLAMEVDEDDAECIEYIRDTINEIFDDDGRMINCDMDLPSALRRLAENEDESKDSSSTSQSSSGASMLTQVSSPPVDTSSAPTSSIYTNPIATKAYQRLTIQQSTPAPINHNPRGMLSIEVNDYFNAVQLPTGCNAATFWRAHLTDFPRVRRIGLVLMSNVGSSSRNEGANSNGGFIKNKRRMRLLPNNFRMLVLLNTNRKYYKMLREKKKEL